MRLSAKSMQEFQDICRDEFGVELLAAEAEARALAVLDLYWVVFVEPAFDHSAPLILDALQGQDVP